MRVLVIGGSGLVGSHVLWEAIARGHTAFGTFRQHPVHGLLSLDLADDSALERVLDDTRPDWVVHAAGWTWVDGCESDQVRAMEENCFQPAKVARACRLRGIRMAYLSTTYVFDGQNGPYDETATPSPINVYGRSKLNGEQAVQLESNGTALILRTICVWGVEKQRKNFVYQAIKSIGAGQKMRLPVDQFGNPTWAGDIAVWAMKLMEGDHHGVWNVAGPLSHVSRAEWFRGIFDGLISSGRVKGSCEEWFVPVSTSDLAQAANRPLHASANIGKLLLQFPHAARHYGNIQDIIADNFPMPEAESRSPLKFRSGDPHS